jgi:hypothetical protein
VGPGVSEHECAGVQCKNLAAVCLHVGRCMCADYIVEDAPVLVKSLVWIFSGWNSVWGNVSRSRLGPCPLPLTAVEHSVPPGWADLPRISDGHV